MSVPHLPRPDLPEHMTWEELEQLPAEIAEQIELWEGRVVWVRRGPREHQRFMRRMTNALERCSRNAGSERPRQCWEVEFETNIFFGHSGRSDFVTPDFMVYRCLPPGHDVRSGDVVLAGEVLSPSNTRTDVEAKKARYASAGIHWYWEIELVREESAVAAVRAYILQTSPGRLAEGVRPLRPANYLLADEWAAADTEGIRIDHPFPILIPWEELAF